MSQIAIKCETPLNVHINKLDDIQGELKEISDENLDKLLNAFKKVGFCDPLVVWNDPNTQAGHFTVIGGNQRLKALKKAVELKLLDTVKGVPCIEVKAKDLDEARKMLIAMAGNYGETKRHNLLGKLKEWNLKPEEFAEIAAFPGVDLTPFSRVAGEKQEEVEMGEGSKEDADYNDILTLSIPFFKKDFEEAETLLQYGFKHLKDKYPDKIKTQSDAYLFIMREFFEKHKAGVA